MAVTKLSTTAKRQRALEYALEGKTARQIGELMGCSHVMALKHVHNAVKGYAKENADNIDALREVMAERYIRLWNQWQEAAEDPESKAGDKLLRILEGLRGLYGLDRPVKKDDDMAVFPTTIVVNRNYVGGKGE